MIRDPWWMLAPIGCRRPFGADERRRTSVAEVWGVIKAMVADLPNRPPFTVKILLASRFDV